ncbi:hypothetical protein SAMN04487785_105234 [Dyella jiangningensis]|uniref:hypothetical protein n=1 Tax=Dyella sp. AtDHG13 TaxID=1938897 RepID=UPI00087F1C3E|nr:hypothetical protein [Dyella sp. AtDHG13]PXV58207.1 hypothetical protein BDW41_10685 [Dyella sp. AtDHG13]SDK11903.1 hypothetical protein SAMN04487785_105234 [Dyella jiangningensis]
MSARIFALLGLTAALLVCALLYWPAMHGPFLFDDFPNLAALDSIDHVSSWRDLGIYLSQPRSFPGRPVAMLSFLLQKSSWPSHPFPFRLINVSIHLLNGALVFALVRRVSHHWLSGRLTADSLEGRACLTACIAAAAWLLNPIQLSGVVLVVQRMTLLMAMFMLLGLLAYTRGLLAGQKPIWQRGAWMVLGLGVCMGLAFLSKENGILLPIYALVLDATLLRTDVQRLPSTLSWLRRLLIWPAVLFVLSYLLWTLFSEWEHTGTRDFTIGQRLLTEPRILLDYLGKIFLPRFGLYGLYHDGYPVSRSLFSPWSTLPALLTTIGALIAALASYRRWPLFALAVLWYLGGQLLESSTVMLELYFEHRNYMPLIGPVMALALIVARQPQGRQQRMLYMASCIWLMACCITTALSAGAYASEDRLALVWANTQPDSVRAQTYLAERLYKHRQLDATRQVLDKAIQLHPNTPSLAEDRVLVQCAQGDLTQNDLDKLIVLLRTARFDQSGLESIETLRAAATQGSCPALTSDAWLSITSALLSNPLYVNNRFATGYLHYQRHFWAVSQGDLNMAIHELEATYQNDPDANIPRLEAQYLASAHLYDQAVDVLSNTDYHRLPLLRRLLVDDRSINAADIAAISQMRKDERNARGETE